jgi:hypothetical protein
MGFFDKKSKIVPFNSSPVSAPAAPAQQAVYVVLLGAADAITKKSNPDNPSADDMSLFQQFGASLLRGETSLTPDKIYKTEQDAFAGAKKEYSAHSVSLIKLNVPDGGMNASVSRDRNGKEVEVFNPNIFQSVESIKSVSTRSDVMALASAKEFVRVKPYNANNPVDVDFKLKGSPDPAPEPLFIRRNKI